MFDFMGASVFFKEVPYGFTPKEFRRLDASLDFKTWKRFHGLDSIFSA